MWEGLCKKISQQGKKDTYCGNGVMQVIKHLKTLYHPKQLKVLFDGNSLNISGCEREESTTPWELKMFFLQRWNWSIVHSFWKNQKNKTNWSALRKLSTVAKNVWNTVWRYLVNRFQKHLSKRAFGMKSWDPFTLDT